VAFSFPRFFFTAEPMKTSNSSLNLSRKIIHYRWLILLISGIITLGNYYCFDIPSVLYEPLSQYFEKTTFFDLRFNLLYILYSIPNILIPLFGGYLTDQWGKRLMIVVFSILILFGQFIVSIGCTLKDFNMILFGRFVFGLGGESLMVSLLALLASWFEGKELAFSLGLMFSFARLGSASNAWVSPSIAYDKGVSIVFWFGTLLCFFSFVCTLFVVVLDQLFKSPYESDGHEYSEIEDSEDSTVNSASTAPSEYYPDMETYRNTLTNSRIGTVPLAELPPIDPHLSDYQGPSDLPPSPEVEIPSASPPNRKGQTIHFDDSIENIERNLRVDEASGGSRDRNESLDSDLENPNTLSAEDPLLTEDQLSSSLSPREYFTLEDLQSRKKPLWPPQKNFNFWLVLICCCCIYSAILPFISISNEVIRVAYYGSRAEKHAEAVEYIVSRLQGMLFLLAALLAPLMGLLIDFIGHRPALIITSSVFLLVAHMLMMFGLGNPLVPLLLVGTAYS
jgi:MFS family permease